MSSSLLSYEINVELAKEFSRRGAVSSPIKVFRLEELGISTAPFIARMAPTFHSLPWDSYDPALASEQLVRKSFPDLYAKYERQWLDLWAELDRHQLADPLAGPHFWLRLTDNENTLRELDAIRPFRRRSCCQYLLTQETPDLYRWTLRELGPRIFAQSVSDVRARPRRFATTPETVYRDREIQYLICLLSQFVCQMASVVTRRLRVTLHQMLTYADNTAGRNPAPEGIHQDGSSFIVSALVIERHNVLGGVSNVYYVKDAGLALSYELQPGQGLLQSDTHNEYWHGVTTIYPKDSTQPAYRSILGFDFDLNDSPHLRQQIIAQVM